MSAWDVFQSERLELLRGLSAAEVREALARGELRDDDLIRPTGTSDPWSRLADLPALAEPTASTPGETDPRAESPPEPKAGEAGHVTPSGSAAEARTGEAGDPAPPGPAIGVVGFPVEVEDDRAVGHPVGESTPLPDTDTDTDTDTDDSLLAVPVTGVEDEAPYDPQEEDEAAAEFSLAPEREGKMEDLDLTAMVDVAFQLILFFLVTATSVTFKTLEVPRPNAERPESVAPEMAQTLEELENDYILVGIDSRGAFTVDREPVAADASALARRLRGARESTGRVGMLLTADGAALHRYAVLAYDAANEVGLRIAVARPSSLGRAPGDHEAAPPLPPPPPGR